MRTPAFGRAWTRIRRSAVEMASHVSTALRTSFDRLTTPFRTRPTARAWNRAWLVRGEVRWQRGSESVECFRFADGYVATVAYADRDVTWQLTAGPSTLAGALFTAGLYMQHGVTPQIDPDGRMFVAIGDDGPTQVFEETASIPVEYVYIDAFRTIEELPDCVDVDELDPAYRRLSQDRPRELPPG
ncbi:hypothetical protein [Halegenticoccus tardaugens]|uniref:hypothetical protein n=1 Tax=Halegenticoccus tardaugens TaxID=2071624 RepID=UPI001E56789E|nr:hypothetical protein [Halegenticoccus tardaugens]